MQKYILILSFGFFVNLQAISTVEDLKKQVVHDIKTQLQNQGITGRGTLFAHKQSLPGQTKKSYNGADNFDYDFPDGSHISGEFYEDVYLDANRNYEIRFSEYKGKGTNLITDDNIYPNDNYLLSYAIQQAVDLLNQGPKAKQAYKDIVVVIQELLKRGIKPQLQDIKLASQKEALLKLLTSVAYAPQESLFKAIKAGNITRVHSRIKKNPGAVFAVDSQGRRPLVVALTRAAQMQGCLLGTTRALAVNAPKTAGRINMVLMLLDMAGAQQDVTLIDSKIRHILVSCPELTKELIARTKNKRFIEEVQKLMPV